MTNLLFLNKNVINFLDLASSVKTLLSCNFKYFSSNMFVNIVPLFDQCRIMLVQSVVVINCFYFIVHFPHEI